MQEIFPTGPLSRVAAAITAITQQDIRWPGVRDIPEALRLAQAWKLHVQ